MQVKVDKNGENRVGTCVGVGGMGMVRCGGGARVRGGGAVGRRIGVIQVWVCCVNPKKNNRAEVQIPLTYFLEQIMKC